MWYGSLMASIERQDEFIRSLGVEAYRVGGSVRDEILGRTPKDADYIVRGVSLSVLKDYIEGALPRDGTRHKSVTALKDRQGQQFGWRVSARGGIEISLPRTEWNDGSGRRMGIRVDPNLSLAEDAKRRDFTFNALYRDVVYATVDNSVEDPTGTGVHDLQHRIIRTTHPDSFRDDPLRMLRALRFESTLDADLAEGTWIEMCIHAEALDGLTHKGFTSGTVFDEFSKLLMGQKPIRALRDSVLSGVLAAVMPELADMIGFEGGRNHDLTVDEHTFKAIETAANVEASLAVRWALLFHDSGKPATEWIGPDGYSHFYANPKVDLGSEDHQVVSERLWRAAAKRMNVSRQFTDYVATIIREHMVSDKHRAPGVWVRRKRVQFGDELLRDILLHRACDFAGKKAKAASGITHMRMLEVTRTNAEAARVPTSVKDLAINGEDVKHLEGRERGEALRRVLDEVVCDPTSKKLTREWQLSCLARSS